MKPVCLAAAHPLRRSTLQLRLIAALTALLLGGCGSSSLPASAPPLPSLSAADVCFDSRCGSPKLIVDLPDLENLHPASNGRLFVSGQQNLYEILADGAGGYRAQPLFAGTQGCSGLAESQGLLYMLCDGNAASGGSDVSGLYVLDLGKPDASPQPIFSLTGFTIANGLVAGPGHRLYVTDGPIAAEPKIVRLQLDPADPRRVLRQDTWLSTFPEFPNGLALLGGSLYTTLYNPATATGHVARVDILPDGRAGTPVLLFASGIMDDLNATADNRLLVTDWQKNRLFEMTPEGTQLRTTDTDSFPQASSVDIGGPPLFAKPVVLVTERYTGRGLWILKN